MERRHRTVPLASGNLQGLGREGNGNCDVKVPQGYGMGSLPPLAGQRGAAAATRQR